MPIGDSIQLAELGFTANGQLNDRAIRHAMFLERFKSQETKQVLDYLDDKVLPDLRSNVAKRLSKTKSKLTKARLTALSRSNNTILRAGLSRVAGDQVGRLGQFALSESQWQLKALAESMPISLDFNQPSLGKLTQVVAKTKIGAFGKDNPVLGKWWSNLADSTTIKVEEAIKLGIAQDETVDQIVKRLGGMGKASEQAFGPLGKMKTNARAITRTAVAQVGQDAKEETYKANSDVIGSVQIIATLDSRTTEICMGYDGKVFPVGEGPRPPFHINCRTVTAPITKSWKELLGTKRSNELKLKNTTQGQRAALGGAVPAKTTYGEWLKKQPKQVQDLALGKKKAELFRQGKFKVERLVNAKGQRLTLAQLEQLDDITEFGLKVAEMTQAQIDDEVKSLLMSMKSADAAAKKSIRAKLRKLDKDWKINYDQNTGLPIGKKPGVGPPPPTTASAAKVVQESKSPEKSLVSQADSPVIDSRKMKKIAGKQGGSSQNGVFEDVNGDKWLIKQTKSLDHSKNEVLASKLYEELGDYVSETRIAIWEDGSHGVAVKFLPDLKPINKPPYPEFEHWMADIYPGYAHDAFLANWDVAGAVYDNVGISNDVAYKLDVGGSLLYRAQGSPKGAAFGPDVNEMVTMMTMNKQASQLYANITLEEVYKSALRVTQLDLSEGSKVWGIIQRNTPAGQGDKIWKTLRLRQQSMAKWANEMKPSVMAQGDQKFADWLTSRQASKSTKVSPSLSSKSTTQAVTGFSSTDKAKMMNAKYGSKLEYTQPPPPPPPELGSIPGAKLGTYEKLDFDPLLYTYNNDMFLGKPVGRNDWKHDALGKWQAALQPKGLKGGDNYATEFAEWQASLSKTEVSAIKSFTGSGYVSMRRAARLGETTSEAGKKAVAMQKALDRAPRRQQMQFRGVRLTSSDIESQFNNFTPGSVFEQKAMDSWSADRSTAMGFSGYQSTPGDVTKKSVLFVSPNKAGIDISGISTHGGERELISPVGAKFRVVQVIEATQETGPNKGNKKLIVIVEEVFEEKATNAPGLSPVAKLAEGATGKKFSTQGKTPLEVLQVSTEAKHVRKAIKKHPAFKDIDSISIGSAPLDTQKLIAQNMIEAADMNQAMMAKVKKIAVEPLPSNKVAAFRWNNSTNTGEIVFNKSLLSNPSKLDSMLNQLHKSGEFAGNTLDYVIKHELGHAVKQGLSDKALSESLGYAKYMLDNNKLATSVSKYAATNLDEAFAELYAKVATTPEVSWDPDTYSFAEALVMDFQTQGIDMPPWLKDIADELIAGMGED